MKVQLIGIAGATCSGKTTLLRNLEARLGDKIATFTFDEYFIGSDKYDLDKITNFEDPKHYNHIKFIKDLARLKNGQSLEIRANSRESSYSEITKKTIQNRPYIIVEGFLIFYKPEARNQFNTKIFIELPDDEILHRRFARTSGAKHWDSHDYIQNKIIPYHHKYVEPQKEFADLVVDGMKSPDEIANEVVAFLNIEH